MKPSLDRVHPVCAMFPMLGAEHPALLDLISSVESHGLIDPIVLDSEGRILDGRHRLIACNESDVEPRFVAFSDMDFQGSESSFAFARNLSRRDLTDDQRAALVAKYAEYVKRDPEWRSKYAKEKPREPMGTFVPNGEKQVRASEKVAQQAHVSVRKSKQAIAVAQTAPELLPAVIEGKVKLKDAHKTAVARKQAEPRKRKPTPFDYEGYVDRVEVKIKDIFAKCPAEHRSPLKARVIAMVKDQ